MWLLVLSDQLPIVALVGRYPTNQLIGRRPILKRLRRSFALLRERMRSCHRFPGGIPHLGVGTHVLLTRAPLPRLREGVRLACVRHAASVYPEPGSNSPSSYASPAASRQEGVCTVCTCAIQATRCCSYISRGLFADSQLMIDRNWCGTRTRLPSRQFCSASTLQLSRYPLKQTLSRFSIAI